MNMGRLNTVTELPCKVGLAGPWEAIQKNQCGFNRINLRHVHLCIAEILPFEK
jgi:hypothetical protein